MNNQEIDLLSDLKDSSDEYEQAIFGTYSFDPSFFEWKILPIIRGKDAENVIVLTDKEEYKDRFSDMKSAGQEYYVDYCYAKKTFHPKFVLLLWSDGIKLRIGSSNLTKQSWLDSAELVANIQFDKNDSDKESEQIISQFREFLTLLIQKEYIKSQKHQTKIQEIIDKLPQGNTNSHNNTKLVHNLEKKILPQVIDIIYSQIKSVKILAPFFNKENSIIDYLIKKGCNEFEIFIQPDKVTNFPKKAIKNLISAGKKIKIYSIKSKTNEHRFIHAKILILKTKTHDFCVFGSANPTHSGMLSLPLDGNLELCVLRIEKSNYFDNLVSDELLSINEITVDDIKENQEEALEPTSSENLTILDAYLDKKELIIQPDSVMKIDKCKTLLCHDESDILEISSVVSGDLRIHVELDEKSFEFCSRPTYVKIRIQRNNQEIESDKRWISTQVLELKPRKIDIEKIKITDGRFGLISFLNKLEKFADDSDWFFYFLQRVKFEKIESLEPVRRRIIQRKIGVDEEIEYEKPPKTDIVRSFRDKLEKRQQGLKKTLQNAEEIEISEIERLFNQFLAWSKVIVWFYLRDQKFIDNLRFIRANIEEFLILYDKLDSNQEFKKIVEKNQFWQHLLILSYLIFVFHRKEGYFQNNIGVIKVFAETTNEMIRKFQIDKAVLTAGDFESVFKEYGEFEKLELNFEQISRHYNDEFGERLF